MFSRGGSLLPSRYADGGSSDRYRYPTWDKGDTFQSIPELSKLAAAFPGTRIYIAETSYPAAGHTQPERNYNATPAGQLAYIAAVRQAMADALPPNQNGGVLWWEGGENGWDSLFDQDYVARPALLHGFAGQLRTSIP